MNYKPIIKIVIFSSYFYPYIGGIERYVHNFSKELTNNGVEVILVVSNHAALEDDILIDGFRVLRLPVFKNISQRFPVLKFNSDLIKIVNIINEFDADLYILNTRFFLTSHIGAYLGKKFGKKTILIEHGSGHVQLNNKIFSKFFEFYEHFVTFILKNLRIDFYGVSNRCNLWLLHFNIKAKGVIYNGISKVIHYDKSININDLVDSDKVFSIMFAGRLLQTKGIIYLTEAFDRLSKEIDDVILIIAGGGELYNFLTEKYKNNQQIKLLGEIPSNKVMFLMRESQVVVIPSYYPEGMPTLLLEAGINNCAVITTSQGGTREIILDENYGMIVNPRSVEDIFESLKKIYYNKELLNTLSFNLNKIVLEKFTWETIVKNFLNELTLD